MGLVWRIGSVSGNPKWKGLTWAMIPSHSSGVCACVYHFFYNAESLQFVVLLQAALTLLGNCTVRGMPEPVSSAQPCRACDPALMLLTPVPHVRPQLAFASYRLAVSNGWVFSLPWSSNEDAVAPTAAAPQVSAEGA
eukprot:5798190-Prymnesium_polylepis.1